MGTKKYPSNNQAISNNIIYGFPPIAKRHLLVKQKTIKQRSLSSFEPLVTPCNTWTPSQPPAGTSCTRVCIGNLAWTLRDVCLHGPAMVIWQTGQLGTKKFLGTFGVDQVPGQSIQELCFQLSSSCWIHIALLGGKHHSKTTWMTSISLRASFQNVPLNMLRIYETWILHRSELTNMANIIFHYALKPLWPNDRSLYRSVSNSCSGGATISPLQHLARCVARCACTCHKTPRELILKTWAGGSPDLHPAASPLKMSEAPKTGFLSCAVTNSFLPSPAEQSLLGRIKSTSSP